MLPDNPLFLECFVPVIIIGSLLGWFVYGPFALILGEELSNLFDRIFPPKN